MTGLSANDAIARVRAAVGVADDIAGRAWPVRRLDRSGATYYLVVFGDENASVAVGTVNAVTGDVGNSARLPGHGRHLEVDAVHAKALAGAGETASAELVWRPSPVSRSPLYPVWEVVLPSGTAYVDHAGSVRHDPP